MIRFGLNESPNLDYLDGADWTWKTVRIGNASAEVDDKSAFIDDARRLLIVHTSTGKLRAIDLNNMGAGPVTLRTVGNLPLDNRSAWQLYPVDGCWYMYEGWGGNTLHKIQPPPGNPLTATWTVSTVQIGGPTLPAQGAQAKRGRGS